MRTVRIVGGIAREVVVVAATGQNLPSLPEAIEVVRDHHEGRGPLEGMRAGLSAVAHGSVAFVTGCDTPLLTSAFIERVASLLGEHEIAVPWIDGFIIRWPPSIGRPSSTISKLLADDQRRPTFLFERVNTRP